MYMWVERAINTNFCKAALAPEGDSCHSKNGSVKGVIQIQVIPEHEKMSDHDGWMLRTGGREWGEGF